MNVLEVNKYRPSLFRGNRYLVEDWTAASDIGRQFAGGPLSSAEYLRVENLYVWAIHELMRASHVDALRPLNLERWDDSDPGVEGLQRLEGVQPSNGELLSGERLEVAIRKCLREEAWLELAVPQRFLVHFGYDLRVIVASTSELTEASAAIRRAGLYTYDASSRLPTLDTWLES